ncbi:MAG: hypothetical protein GKR89_34455 [Candidatus Latescibacteria bacterium]|nr:hypothetical protein [Candidatus Latescibacterota bacterium]
MRTALLVVILSLSASLVQAIDSPPDPVGYWAFDGNALDAVGGNHGSAQGGAGFAGAAAA